MRRSLAAAGFGFFLALIAADVFGFNFAVAAAAVLIAAALIMLLFPGVKQRGFAALPFVAGCACVIYCLGVIMWINPCVRFYGTAQKISATVNEAPAVYGDEETFAYTVTVREGDDGLVNRRLLLYSSAYLDCLPGDGVSLTAELSSPDKNSAKHYSDGVFLTGFVNESEDITLTHCESPGLLDALARIRTETARHVASITRTDEASVINAVTFSSTYLTDELYSLFRYIGVSHLFAVSGLHTGIIGQIIIVLLSFFGMKKRRSAIISAAAVWCFTALIGFPPSAVRAAVMFTVYAAGLLFFRRSDPLNSLGFAAMAVTLFSPFSAVDIGLLSSVSSVLGIILLSKPLSRFAASVMPRLFTFKAGRFVINSLSVTFAALTGLLPCTALYYNSLSLITPLSNLLLIPLAYPLLFSSLLGGVLNAVPFLSALSKGAYFISAVCARLCLFISRTLAAIPFANISLGKSYIGVWTGLCLIIAGIAVIASYKAGKARCRAAGISVIMCFVMLFGGVLSDTVFYRPVTEIIVCDVSQGLCVAVCRANRAFLVGCSGNSAVYKTDRLLRARGITEITGLILTDSDTSEESADKMCGKINSENIFYAGENAPDYIFARSFEKISSVSFWDGCRADFSDDTGAITVTAGGTEICIVPAAAEIPVNRRFDAVIACREAKGYSYQSGAPFIVSASPGHSAAVCAAVSASGSDAWATGGNGSVALYTRGKNDITARRLCDA